MLRLFSRPGLSASMAILSKRLATYADVLGTTYSEGWRQDAAWIAEQALNKPLVLKLDSGASVTTSRFVSAMLAASGTSVEIASGQSRQTPRPRQRRMRSEQFPLTHYITGNVFAADSTASPFTVAVEGGAGSGENRSFGSGPSDLVIVARVNGSPDSPKTVRLQGVKSGPFEIRWYDPVTGATLPAGEVAKTDKGLAQTCACTSEYALISVHKQSENDQTVLNTIEVKGGIELKVEEIVARWQQNREAQKQRLENYMASSFMSLHFENTNLGPGFDVSTQLKVFFSRGGKQMEMAQKAFYVNGVKFGKNLSNFRCRKSNRRRC